MTVEFFDYINYYLRLASGNPPFMRSVIVNRFPTRGLEQCKSAVFRLETNDQLLLFPQEVAQMFLISKTQGIVCLNNQVIAGKKLREPSGHWVRRLNISAWLFLLSVRVRENRSVGREQSH